MSVLGAEILTWGSVYLVHSLVIVLLLIYLFHPFSVRSRMCFDSLSLTLTCAQVNLGAGQPVDDSIVCGSGVMSRVVSRSGSMWRKRDPWPPSSHSYRLKRVCSRQGTRSDEARNESVIGTMVSSAMS